MIGPATPADAPLDPAAVEAWLAEPTDETCSRCGQQALRKFEALNGRCETCRIKYEAKARGAEGNPWDPECGECNGSGWQIFDDGGAGTASRCNCDRRAEGDRILERLRHAGVSPEYYQCTWETWEGQVDPKARAFVREPERHRVLYVHGLQGRGKTHLATAAFRELLARDIRCEWRDCPGLVDRFREWTGRNDHDRMDAEEQRLYEADVLLLDDFGSRRQTDFAVDLVDRLIRFRHERRFPMILTSNRSLAMLVAPEGEGGLGRDPAIASRLTGLEIHLTGPDRRRKGVGT